MAGHPQTLTLGLQMLIFRCMKASKHLAETAVRTSLVLPRELWKAAHVRALDEGRDLRSVITSALELYLKTTRGKEQAR